MLWPFEFNLYPFTKSLIKGWSGGQGWLFGTSYGNNHHHYYDYNHRLSNAYYMPGLGLTAFQVQLSESSQSSQDSFRFTDEGTKAQKG